MVESAEIEALIDDHRKKETLRRRVLLTRLVQLVVDQPRVALLAMMILYAV
jgi:hypothetical protein